MEISTPRQLLRSLGPLPETSARPPPRTSEKSLQKRFQSGGWSENCPKNDLWEKLNRGVSKPGCFPLFSGKVQIVSRTLSGLFLVGARNRPRKRKRTNRGNPRTIPEQIGKIPEKSGKSQKGQKRTRKEGQVQIGKPPRLKHPRLAALETCCVGKIACRRR